MPGDLIPEQIQEAIRDHALGRNPYAPLYPTADPFIYRLSAWSVVRNRLHRSLHRFLFPREARELESWQEHIC